ncbi:MAG: class F sortase [Anaerolineae bacterium]|nr:class F sortase [Anaerolineae bacterium]
MYHLISIILHPSDIGSSNAFDIRALDGLPGAGGWGVTLILILVLLVALVGIGLCLRLMGSQARNERALLGVVTLVLLGVAGGSVTLLFKDTAVPSSSAQPSASMSESTPGWGDFLRFPTRSSPTMTPTEIDRIAETEASSGREVESAPTPTGLVAPRSLATRLQIPTIEVDAPIVRASVVGKSWDVSKIYDEVAYLEGTAYPGGPGNAVLAGHSTHLRGNGPFRLLTKLAIGDIIIVEGDGMAYVYRVLWIKETGKENVEVAYPTIPPVLTLITCTQWDPESRSYQKRLIVRAELIEQRKIEAGTETTFSH